MDQGFSFQDGTPFPGGRELFDWIIDVFTVGRDVASCLANLIELERRRAEEKDFQRRETILAEQLSSSLMKVVESTMEHSVNLPKASALSSRIARFVGESARESLEENRRDAALQSERYHQSKEQNQARIYSLTSQLMLKKVAPISAPSSFHLGEDSISARCALGEDIRIDFLLETSLLPGLRLVDVSESMSFPKMVHGHLVPRDLEDWLVVKALVTASGCDLTLKKNALAQNTVILTVLKSGDAANARLTINGQVTQLEDASGTFVNLQQNFYRMLVSRVGKRRSITRAVVGEHDVYSMAGVDSFFSTIIDTIAPLAEELSRRSFDGSVWTIMGEGMEFRLRTQSLIESLPPLHGPLRAQFERIPLLLSNRTYSTSEGRNVGSVTRVSKRPTFEPDTLPGS